MQHYAVIFTTAANQNAINVVLALLFGDNPSQAVELSRPAVPSDGPNTAEATYFYGGLPRTTEQVAVLQDLPNNIPAASWPVTGVDGPVTEAEAAAAAAAMFLFVGTAETYETTLAASTLAAALEAKSLQKQAEPE
jgi:hypothetical protein